MSFAVAALAQRGNPSQRGILTDGIEFTEYTTGGYMHHDCRESSLLSECRLAYPEDCAGTLNCQPQFNSVQ
jgi:hypothetical protein